MMMMNSNYKGTQHTTRVRLTVHRNHNTWCTWPELELPFSGRHRLRACTTPVAVCLTFVKFNLKLKFCPYTIVHLLGEEFRISCKSSLYKISTSHLIYAPKWASANFVDSWCPFRCSNGCVLLLHRIFLKTMYRSTIPLPFIWSICSGN